ncbi:MAG: fused MFS/spermidine synthase [Chloroflexota bacterium]
MTARAMSFARPILDTAVPFAVPIGLSAFLLFSVQPLVGRLMLPVFGGTPAVWATSLFFFQGVLLAGYVYGHLSVTRLGRWGPPLHVVLAVGALISLLAAPSEIGGARIDVIPPGLDLVRILFIVVGLPALVLTTTTPLVSGWFEAARHRSDGDPYWLYALSNGGSLLALLAYPLLIEPRLPLSTQRGLWALGYAALIVLLVGAAARALPAIRDRAAERAAEREAAREAARTTGLAVGQARGTSTATSLTSIAWRRRARWLLLAAVPSGLLSAVTTFIATDLVSAPLLWVAPLSIYLVSFVIAFSPRGGRWVGRAVRAAPAMVTLLWVPYGSAGGWPIVAILAMELAAFGIVATALHGRLAEDRPDPSRLTEFYLILALGGALASAFVALVAPAVFPGVWEYPLLLVGALAGLALVTTAPARRPGPGRGLNFSPFVHGVRGRMAPYGAAALALIAALLGTGSIAAEAGARWLLVGALVLALGARPWFLALTTAFVLGLATFVLQPPAVFRDRSFFGVTQVLVSRDGQLTLLMNGTTVHGSQATDPARHGIPLSYYAQSGPAGDLFAIAGERRAEALNVGVAGLGGGALATYVDDSTTMTFFEIDPIVIAVASDARYFTYLGDAVNRPTIVEGDARRSLEREPDGRFDLLIMDAFSSDAVPVHLLTVEAIADERRTVTFDGILAFHISNRYYDLAPAIAAGVGTTGLTVLEKHHDPGIVREPGELPSRWLAATRSEATLDALRTAGWAPVRAADDAFTDNYADLLGYLYVAQ